MRRSRDLDRTFLGPRAAGSRPLLNDLLDAPRDAPGRPEEGSLEGASTEPDGARRKRSKAARRAPRRPLERASQTPTARSATTPTEGFRIPLWRALGNRRHDGPRGLNPRAPTAPGTTLRGGQEDPRETPRRGSPTASARGLAGPLDKLRRHPPRRPHRPSQHPPPPPSQEADTDPPTTPGHDLLRRPRRPPRHPRRGPHRPPQQPSAAQPISTPSATTLPRGRYRPSDHPPAHLLRRPRRPPRHPPRGPHRPPQQPSASTRHEPNTAPGLGAEKCTTAGRWCPVRA